MIANRPLGLPTRSLDVRDLLRIDVDAELRKVTRGQLLGPWQIPTELVRRAVRAGATSIDVRFRGDRVVVTDNGPPLDAATLRHFAELIDRQANTHVRHTALAGLEAAGEQALLCIAGHEPTRLEVTTSSETHRHQLGVARRRVELRSLASAEFRGTRISLASRVAAGSRARAWLQQACGFVSVTLRVDGERISSPFANALFTAPLDDPFPGQMAFASMGETARAWLLLHGVVGTHVHISPAPPFDATVELGHVASVHASAADLRALLEPQLRDLVSRALAYLSGLARRSNKLPSALQTRVTEILLGTAIRHSAVSSLDALPMFAVLTDQEIRWLELAELRSLARARGNRLLATDPEQRDLHLDMPCLLASPRVRHLLSELTHVRFEPPLEKGYRGSWGTRWRERASTVWARAGVSLRRTFRRAPRPVDPAQRTQEECSLVAALARFQSGPGTLQIELCYGHGPIFADARHVWLPRDNAEVRRAALLFARDSNRWSYPVAMALIGEHCPIAPQDRQLWWRSENG